MELVNTRNHGVAFGFLPGSHLGVTILIGHAVLALLAYFARHARSPVDLAAHGHAGRRSPRQHPGPHPGRRGHGLPLLPLGWPPFNLADASITLGILLLFVVIDRARGGPR